MASYRNSSASLAARAAVAAAAATATAATAAAVSLTRDSWGGEAAAAAEVHVLRDLLAESLRLGQAITLTHGLTGPTYLRITYLLYLTCLPTYYVLA